MKGKPYRLLGKASSKDIMAFLNISSRTFYRYAKNGIFQNLVQKDPISKDYFAELADLPRLKKILNLP